MGYKSNEIHSAMHCTNDSNDADSGQINNTHLIYFFTNKVLNWNKYLLITAFIFLSIIQRFRVALV